MSLPPLIDALCRPQSHPDRPSAVRLLQTHISYVLVAGPYVYKIKKPVRFTFLDFSTLERRRFYCHEEVRLNRRLAPDVYIGVVSICPDGAGFRFGAVDDAEAVEYAVQMRCLDEARRLDNLLKQGSVDTHLIDRIADRLIDFHAAAAGGPDISANGAPSAVWAILQDNYANARTFRGVTIEAEDDDEIQSFARRFLERHDALFRARQVTGRIRDCHGDLHADHIYADDPVVIVDCVEFSTQFRYCDVVSDLAFLAMDLDFHARSDLSLQLVDRYIGAAGDAAGRPLLPFYQCYRAYVRGKVDSLKSCEPEVGADERDAAKIAARAHFELSYRYTWSQSAGLVAITGMSGSGKSALAGFLSRRTGFLHVSSDIVRKQLAGLAPTERPQGAQRSLLYGDEHSSRTYAQMGDIAARTLADGHGVIVDATFQRRRSRDALRALAGARGVPCLFVECQSPDDVIRSRLATRSAAGDSPSDADEEIYLQQRRSFERFENDEAVLAVDTNQPLARAARVVERRLRQLRESVCGK